MRPGEDDLPVKRLRELALRASHREETCFTRFLDPALEDAALRAAAQSGVRAMLWGGYEDAERRVCAFYPDAPPERDQYPLCCIGVRWNEKFASPGHRDVLGAVMGLGLDRECVGDVAMCREGACVFVHPDVTAYVLSAMDSVGRAGVRLECLDRCPEILQPQGEEFRVTVSAMRMDAILAAGYRLSRAEAQRMISAGMVKHNHAEELRGDCRVEQGDLLSVRGMGRLKIVCLEGETKKGRLGITLFRYGRK